MSREAAIVGVAESDLGHTRLSVLDLHTQAITRALADAGLSLSDVDGLATNAIGRFPVTYLAEHLGLRPRWSDSTFAGGSVGVDYVARAAHAIERGDAELVVVSWASNQRSAQSRNLGGVPSEDMPDHRLEAPYAPLYPISFYAMAAHRWMHQFHRHPEDLAEVAVSARRWALLNPKAYRHDAGALTVSDVIESPLVSSPLHTLDCCLVTDGGGAVVLASGMGGIRLLGHGESTTHASMSQAPDLIVTGAVASGRTAFSRAGLSPSDVDVLEVYDSFTITVVLTLESLGFCDPGDGAGFVRDHILPMNTSGGGLSYCHPGQMGILLVVEAVRQLRGECAGRQVAGAQIALCHGTGGIQSHHATLLLGVK